MTEQPSFIACRPTYLPPELWVQAAEIAGKINPENVPPGAIEKLKQRKKGERLALSITSYWGIDGVRLTVGFLDNPEPELRRLILSHMNAWSETANIEFVESNDEPEVRIARFDKQSADPGRNRLWSYLGTQIRSIHKTKPTMNLEGFTLATPDRTFRRVVRHEAGHTLGFEHEQLRAALIQRLDVARVIEEYRRIEGWDEDVVREKILTPIEDVTEIKASTAADQLSIMCYPIEPYLTLDGRGIIGGEDISDADYAFAAAVYPK